MAEAQAGLDHSGERWWEAELYRLRAELLLARPGDHRQEAEGCAARALAIARRQQALSLELRAVITLVRLRQRQARGEDVYTLLESVLRRFTEGFTTPDLHDARMLLQQGRIGLVDPHAQPGGR